jgi:hypothetical protein
MQDENEMEAEIWRELFALLERAQLIITKYTVCIYVWQEKISQLTVAGTGVLLRVGERRFLLSAAHVLDLAFFFHMPLAVQPNDSPGQPIELAFVSASVPCVLLAARSTIPI